MKRLLYIAHRLPYPPNKGERIRAFRQIVSLSDVFDVTVATACTRPSGKGRARELTRWCSDVLLAPAGGLRTLRGALSLLAGKSLTEGYFRNVRLMKLIRQAHQMNPFDVVVGYSSSMLPYVQAVDAPSVMDLVDADSAKWASYAGNSGWPMRSIYQREHRRVAALERQAIADCDAAVVISEAEAEMLGELAEKVQVVGNGVDAGYFVPDVTRPAKLGSAAVVFVGSMDYRPNVEAARWFAEQVWPELHARVEDATFNIVGRSPSSAVQRLAKIPGVNVTGFVEDVRPYIAAASAVVCPLKIARGIQNKVLEALAMARPVVASAEALEGLDLQPGQHVQLADTPDQWRERILEIFTDRPAAELMAQTAMQYVVNTYTWRRRLQPLVDICRDLTDQRVPAMQEVS